MTETSYDDFIRRKSQVDSDDGFAPIWMPEKLFDFQSHLVDWALRKGRAALFTDTGTGKSFMELAWAENVVRHTNKPVLVLTPLAVAQQVVREGAKLGVEVHRAHDGAVAKGVNVVNYERLHLFDAADFGGVVCDESGILKSFDGTRRKQITGFMRAVPHRLLGTATPSPNDFYELGSSSEALGYLGFMDMLSRFFKNARNNASLGRAWATAGGGGPQWRFRGHAERPFWRWVVSWARAMRKPSDLGTRERRTGHRSVACGREGRGLAAMAVTDRFVRDQVALFCGDCMAVVQKMKADNVHLSVYSPPFAGLYSYSSNDHDFSNCQSYDEFMVQYGYLVAQLARVTVPGRITAVHCMDVPSGNTGRDHLTDFPGDIIRLHAAHGFKYVARYCVWKDPFVVYLRTLAKGLRHRTCTEDSSRCTVASADYLLVFRKAGENKVAIEHPKGLLDYAGSRQPPANVLKYRGHTGKQTENKYSQWVWRQYASAFWDDVRLDRVLPYREAKEPDDERHVHPLQLDVIDRCLALWSNPGDTVFTPFMGVGSEVYAALKAGRRAVGVELKPSYYRQAQRNIEAALAGLPVEDASKQVSMFVDEADPWSDLAESPEEEATP